MNFPPQSASIEIAAKALTVVLCLSVSFGNAAVLLLRSLLPTEVVVADQASLAEHSSVPEEAPQESPSSNEPTEEVETATFAVRRNSPKSTRIYFQLVKVARLSDYQLHSAQALHAGNRTPNSRFEHCYRNGCGTHWRC